MLSMTSVTNRKPNVSDGIAGQGFWINTAFSRKGWNGIKEMRYPFL
jgi:hypothetical protein